MEMKPTSSPDQSKPDVDIDLLMEQIRSEIEHRGGHGRSTIGPVEPIAEGGAAPLPGGGGIMARVRAEIVRRRVADMNLGRGDGREAPVREFTLPTWQPAAARLADRPRYVLSDFLRFDDEDFVDIAYSKLLRRPADPAGREGYVTALRSGVLSKVEILGSIRFSEEGRERAVHVDGLLLPYKLHHLRHRRMIGWFVGMTLAIARLPRLAWRLQGMEASAAREAQQLGRLMDRSARDIERQFAELDSAINAVRAGLTQAAMARTERFRDLDARVEAVQASAESLSTALRDGLAAQEDRMIDLAEAVRVGDAARGRLIDGLAAQGAKTVELSETLRASDAARGRLIEGIQQQLATQEDKANELAETLRASDTKNASRYMQNTDRLTVHEAALSRLEEQTQSDHRSLRALLDRMSFFLDTSAQQARNSTQGDDRETALEMQYASFEEAFRGDREAIKRRAAQYLDTLAAAGIQPGDEGAVLDLGSGRGEWLELLAEHGYRGLGVDSNRGMVELSRAHGNDVVEADALQYLCGLPEGSLAAVTSMHMVEHMPHPVVIQLLDQAMRALRPGGLLVLETPNPENILVGSCMFYMDPTHLHPIPPPLLHWVVQARGFEGATIERLTAHRGSSDLVPVSDKIPGAAQINQMIAWFTAPPDYAVIARKPDSQGPAAV